MTTTSSRELLGWTMYENAQMANDVRAELTWDSSVRSNEIGILATDGIVMLTGSVPTYAEKLAAERAAQRAPGVKAVVSELVVTREPSRPATDMAIARAVVSALESDPSIPAPRVSVAVTRGWITLAGDVELQHERDAAADTVRGLPGVRGVTNEITVSSRLSPAM